MKLEIRLSYFLSTKDNHNEMFESLFVLHFIKGFLLLVVITGLAFEASSQEVSGNIKYQPHQGIKLLGYDGFKTVELATDTIDNSGNFSLLYEDYNGMGYIETADESQLFLVINEPQINIKGTHLKEPDSITFKKSLENQIFNQYAVEHNQREQALAGWKYLLPQYKNVDVLKKKEKYTNLIQKEIHRIEQEDSDFLNQLNSSTYVSWYLPYRKLLDDIPLSAQRFTDRIPKHIADFRKIDFNASKLYHSGILDDLIESHYWLIENGGMTMDSMYVQMNLSTDHLVRNLEGNDKVLNEIGSFLFNLLEKRSLYTASEYLAVKLLTQNSCTLEDNLARQMETYRAMKVGKKAPEIDFKGLRLIMGSPIKKDLKLSDLKSNFTLVVFGSSWCPSCVEEIPKIKDKYVKWKSKGLETVFISLDSNKKEFKSFVSDFPFLSVADLKGWDSKIVKDYYIFATPTMFLLDEEREIILRPSSIEQVDAWVDYKIEPKK